jgi:hypothetical protein
MTGSSVSVTGAVTGSSATVGTGNITVGDIIMSGAIVDSAQLDIQTSASNANIVLTPNGTGNVNTPANVSVTGNVQAGNIQTVGLVSATGNVTGNNFVGNGSALTGLNAFGTVTVSGQSNIVASGLNAPLTFAAGSNIAITTGGNTVTIAYSAAASSSIFATGGDMGLIANPVTASEDLGTVIVVADTSYDLGTLFVNDTFNQIDMTGFTSNINTGNLNAVGLANIVGNINGGNITTVGLISATGNATSGNVLTGGLVSATGNVTGGNLRTVGLISATGNIILSTNGFIGIGTATPDSELNILATPQTVSYSISGNSTTLGTDLHISGSDSAQTRITQDSFGANVYVAFTGRTARGTASSPTQTLLGDTIAQFTGRGFSNGSLQFGNASTGRVDVVAAENFTDTSRATNVQIFTTAASSITPTAIATFSSANGLSVGGNVTGGNILTGGLISATANITGGNILITSALSVGGNITSRAILETATITAAAPAAPTNFDIVTQAVQYYTANANANVTVNFRGSATVTANVLLATGQSTTIALLWTNGATAYYPNVIQVDGANVTPKWQGGTAVSGGNANAIDVYAFTIIKTAATPTYVVLGSQTKFS